MESAKQKYECTNCKTILTIDKEKDISNFKCCKKPDHIIFSTEYLEEEWEEINLNNLHRVYKKYLYIEELDRIDVVLAVALSSKMDGIPLWLILVGPSGDMKSMQLNSIRTEDTYVLHNLTSKTLVNGYKDKEKHPDLAPELKNKIIIIPDMAQILKLPPNEKGEVWGQLRDLYDGLAGKVSGQGARARYEGIKTSMLAGSTPAIDAQILVHQDLGTRELIYRTHGNNNKDKLMEKCFDNEKHEDRLLKDLRKVTADFIKKREIWSGEVKKEIIEEIKIISLYISVMRATAEFDSYTHELRNQVYPEEPTRISKQMFRMYKSLKSLDNNYPDLNCLRIMWHIAKSSAFPIRVKIFELIRTTEGELSTSQISEIIKIGKATTKRECAVLENMNIFKCRRQPTSYPDRSYEYWSYNHDVKLVYESNFIIKTV